MTESYIRKPNFFEKLLLLTGIFVVIVGYIFIHRMILIDQVISWDVVIAIFLWFIIIVLIVIAAVSENVKEEIKFIIEEEIQKLKFLRGKIK